MKKYLCFIILTLCSLVVYSQVEVICPWNIAFGTSHDLTEALMLKVWNNKHKAGILSDSTVLFYSDCWLKGEKVKAVNFDFVDDKMYVSRIWFRTEPRKLFRLYERLREEMIQEYGTPYRTDSTFHEPYRKGDGHEIKAVDENKADFSTTWFLPDSDNSNYMIVLSITSYMNISVTYADTNLYKMKIRKEINKKE